MNKQHENILSFIIKFGSALQEYGSNAYRTEGALTNLSQHFKTRGEFFFTPTFLMGCLTMDREQISRLKRVEPGSIDLNKLSSLDELGNDILEKDLDLEEAHERLNQVMQTKPIHGQLALVFAFGLLSGATNIFFTNSIKEMFASFVIGLTIGLSNIYLQKTEHLKNLSEAIGAFISTVLSITVAYYIPEVNYKSVLLSGIIALLPGLALTTAMAELATNNLASGTARFMGAIMSLLKIAFGTAFATKLMLLIVTIKIPENPVLPYWQTIIAVVLASIALTALFGARYSDFKWIIFAGFVGLFSAQLGNHLFGPEMGPFLGGLSVGATSNYFARRFKRPALILFLPGIILLVPGSIGFKGMSYIFNNDVLVGVGEAIRMLIISISLVGGLLFGNILVRPKRNL